MKYVYGAGVAVVLGLPQRQREDLPYLWLVIVHEVGRSVSFVRVLDEAVGVVSVVRWRCRTHRCRQ